MRLTTSNKKILITGANGQLGNAFQEIASQFVEYECVFATREMLDITAVASIKDAIEVHQPDVIINTAAYTAVDAAESHQEDAYLLNEHAVGHLATLCASYSITLIHISTDYVFDGNSDTPYTEEDIPNPQTIYGKSKLAGEHAIQNTDNLTYAIVRTSWLFSGYGHNFYNTMVRLGNEREELTVVNDQHGIPTFANDLADAIFQMITRFDDSHKGIYHYSNSGVTTWYAFAKAIFDYSQLDVKLRATTSDAYPTVAKRPKNSILDSTKIVETFGVNSPDWNKALQQII